MRALAVALLALAACCPPGWTGRAVGGRGDAWALLAPPAVGDTESSIVDLLPRGDALWLAIDDRRIAVVRGDALTETARIPGVLRLLPQPDGLVAVTRSGAGLGLTWLDDEGHIT